MSSIPICAEATGTSFNGRMREGEEWAKSWSESRAMTQASLASWQLPKRAVSSPTKMLLFLHLQEMALKFGEMLPSLKIHIHNRKSFGGQGPVLRVREDFLR